MGKMSYVVVRRPIHMIMAAWMGARRLIGSGTNACLSGIRHAKVVK